MKRDAMYRVNKLETQWREKLTCNIQKSTVSTVNRTQPRQQPLPDVFSLSNLQTHHDLSMVRMSTVPAPPADPDPEPELKYLDLALDTPPPDPSRSQASASHGAPTEYREIDFIKTQALQDTKRARNMKK